MSIARISAATLAASLLAAISFSATAADDKIMQSEHAQRGDVALEHMIDTAKGRADYEAIAKRFEDEAIQLEKQATEHDRIASKVRGEPKSTKFSYDRGALAAHCDTLAKDLRAAAKEAREIALLHRDVAKTLN